LCCINYKLDGGRPMLLEINPRFGYSLCFDVNRFLAAYVASLGPQPTAGHAAEDHGLRVQSPG
jgi:hypothetical protein